MQAYDRVDEPLSAFSDRDEDQPQMIHKLLMHRTNVLDLGNISNYYNPLVDFLNLAKLSDLTAEHPPLGAKEEIVLRDDRRDTTSGADPSEHATRNWDAYATKPPEGEESSTRFDIHNGQSLYKVLKIKVIVLCKQSPTFLARID